MDDAEARVGLIEAELAAYVDVRGGDMRALDDHGGVSALTPMLLRDAFALMLERHHSLALPHTLRLVAENVQFRNVLRHYIWALLENTDVFPTLVRRITPQQTWRRFSVIWPAAENNVRTIPERFPRVPGLYKLFDTVAIHHQPILRYVLFKKLPERNLPFHAQFRLMNIILAYGDVDALVVYMHNTNLGKRAPMWIANVESSTVGRVVPLDVARRVHAALSPEELWCIPGVTRALRHEVAFADVELTRAALWCRDTALLRELLVTGHVAPCVDDENSTSATGLYEFLVDVLGPYEPSTIDTRALDALVVGVFKHSVDTMTALAPWLPQLATLHELPRPTQRRYTLDESRALLLGDAERWRSYVRYAGHHFVYEHRAYFTHAVGARTAMHPAEPETERLAEELERAGDDVEALVTLALLVCAPALRDVVTAAPPVVADTLLARLAAAPERFACVLGNHPLVPADAAQELVEVDGGSGALAAALVALARASAH